MPLTRTQAVAEVIAGCNDEKTYTSSMPAVHVDDDYETAQRTITVHIGPNELATLASVRQPAMPRNFATLDAALAAAFELCALAGLQGFQRVEVCQHIGDGLRP